LPPHFGFGGQSQSTRSREKAAAKIFRDALCFQSLQVFQSHSKLANTLRNHYIATLYIYNCTYKLEAINAFLIERLSVLGEDSGRQAMELAERSRRRGPGRKRPISAGKSLEKSITAPLEAKHQIQP